MRRSWVVLAAATMVAATACSGQGSDGRGEIAAPPSDPAKVSGEITVLTNRTDQIADGTPRPTSVAPLDGYGVPPGCAGPWEGSPSRAAGRRKRITGCPGASPTSAWTP